MRLSTDILWRITGAIMIRVWNHEEKRAQRAPLPELPAVPAPPNFTIWIQTAEADSPHLVDKAQTIGEAAAHAIQLASRVNAPVLILDTATGEGWVFEHTKTNTRRRE